MGLIGKEVAGRQAKEVELMKVQIKKEDVQLIVSCTRSISSHYNCFNAA